MFRILTFGHLNLFGFRASFQFEPAISLNSRQMKLRRRPRPIRIGRGPIGFQSGDSPEKVLKNLMVCKAAD
jgi:hypothetical protein